MRKTRSALGTGRLFACSAVVLLWSLAALRAAPLEAQPAQSRAFIECDREELIRAVPELASMQFDSTQDRLPGILAPAAENLEGMFARLVAAAATEQIHEMRFEDGAESSGRWETYRYLVRRLAEGSPEPFTELRVGPDPNAPTPAPADGFLVIAHFEKLLRYLLPPYRQDSRFRYLGRVQEAGKGSWLGVVAFAQRTDSVQPLGNIQLRTGRIATMQGLVWIDEATHRIVRLRVDLAERIEGSPFETLSTDIAFAAVKFPSIGSALWLPARVTIHGQEKGAELHTVHRYSDYQLDGRGAAAATMVATASGADDPWEMLERGISLGRENKLPESIVLLHGALRLNPEMAAARYHLAAALRAAGDFAGAEDALREALRRAPESGPTHNLLGLILFKRGDVAGAVAELRASAQLQPKNAIVHFNLARVLEKVDAKSALDEYRIASTLAPDNAAIKVGYEQFERAATAAAEQAATGATIKVEVRQVLVPVVVRDKEGHHVSGLTQADFHVFEDGVEQKISSFAVENAGVGSAVPAAAGSEPPPAAGGVTPPAPPAQTPLAPRVVRRTYLICIDSLNSKFANIVHVRAALAKLMRQVADDGSNGAAVWWWPGGASPIDGTDYGIVNPDGSPRDSANILAQWNATFAGAPPHLASNPPAAGQEHRGPISKQRNKHLQTILIEAAKLAPRHNPRLAAVHEGELKRGHRNQATLAVARKLVAYLMAVDKSGKPFQVRASAGKEESKDEQPVG